MKVLRPKIEREGAECVRDKGWVWSESSWQTWAWTRGLSRAPPAAGCWRRCGCITLPAAAPGPRWRTESHPPPAYGSRCRFPDGREIRCCNPCSCRHLKPFEAVNVSLPSGRSPWTPLQTPCCGWACAPSAWRWGRSCCGPPESPRGYGSCRRSNQITQKNHNSPRVR